MKKVQRFGVYLEVEIPETYKSISISSSIKQLIDGVISSFHVHDGSDIEISSERLANTLNVSKDIVKKLLLENNYAIPGKRKLLWPYRSHVQWSPEDNICLAGEILTKPYTGTGYRISGKLFEIEPL